MADDDVKYELKMVRTIRGTEARTTAKWQKEGWELVTQSQGVLQTQITFRRPKAKTSWRKLIVVGAVAVLLVGVIVIGVSLEEDGSAESRESSSEVAVVPSEQPSAEPVDEPKLTAPVEEEMLTIDSSADLAALLSGSVQGLLVEDFAAKYEGQLIEFDGSIGAMAPHGDYDTRYDILISNGDYSETQSSGGPSFQFRDVNATYDLHLIGDNIPDSVGVRDNVHVVARVGEFETDSLLFLLEPVSTQFR